MPNPAYCVIWAQAIEYGIYRFDAADFLVGGAGTGSALTIQGSFEIGISG